MFDQITALVTWIWVGAFAGMTVSSAIPPIVHGDASILTPKTPLSFVCYWVIPFALLGLAALASRGPDRPDDRRREQPTWSARTTFVAFPELEIDQLYLPRPAEQPNAKSAQGMEAYDIRIGSKGVPLVGRRVRESWPATYKVRERKR